MPRYFKRTTSVRTMTNTERAWVAGILEGEGSFLSIPKRGLHQARVSMQMTDLDVISRVAAIVGAGAVHTVSRPNRPERKPCWGWRIQSMVDVLTLTDQIYDFMGERRQQQIDQIRAVLRPPIAWDPAA